MQEYDPSKYQQSEENEDQGELSEKDKTEEEYSKARKKSKEKFVPASAHYQDKYKHIIGSETGLEAARKAEPNVKFGMGKCYICNIVEHSSSIVDDLYMTE